MHNLSSYFLNITPHVLWILSSKWIGQWTHVARPFDSLWAMVVIMQPQLVGLRPPPTPTTIHVVAHM
jgi:hypothetical protein